MPLNDRYQPQSGVSGSGSTSKFNVDRARLLMVGSVALIAVTIALYQVWPRSNSGFVPSTPLEVFVQTATNAMRADEGFLEVAISLNQDLDRVDVHGAVEGAKEIERLKSVLEGLNTSGLPIHIDVHPNR
jgi:hypothetical protein